jgi:glutamate dehydrogenase (NADP+)
MKDRADTLTDGLIDPMTARLPDPAAYLQTIRAVAQDVMTVEKASADYTAARVMDRLARPDRVIAFRIDWRDDRGRVQVNQGWRVQHSNLLGPYKGGLRWHPGTDLPTLQSLAFEQSFKNALTGLPLGGAKGGADFDPSGRSAGERERFAAAFMAELGPHIGPDRDVPAGDMGVGAHELGLMARAWSRQAQAWGGALTGKPLCLGGSRLRAEATGFGLVYFLCAMLAERDTDLDGQRIAISGRGNVARFAAQKAMALGGRVISLSARAGTWDATDGLTPDALDWLAEANADQATDLPSGLGLRFRPGTKPWALGADIALPCATQNEIDAEDARALLDGGCRILAEGANMPVTEAARQVLDAGGVVQAPGKAANAGGVAVSGMEMRQNAGFFRWDAGRVDAELRTIMRDLHALVAAEARALGGRGGTIGAEALDYRRGANVAGYRRLARAMVEGGVL